MPGQGWPQRTLRPATSRGGSALDLVLHRLTEAGALVALETFVREEAAADRRVADDLDARIPLDE
jgi:hypothetical protein